MYTLLISHRSIYSSFLLESIFDIVISNVVNYAIACTIYTFTFIKEKENRKLHNRGMTLQKKKNNYSAQ